MNTGRIVNGYAERTFDITSALRYGAGNEIQVTVHNDEVPNSRWYSGSGIYRPVTAGLNLMIAANAAKGQEMYNEEGGINAGAASDLGGEPAQQAPDMGQMDSTMFNQMTMMVGTGMNHAADGEDAHKATSPFLDLLDIAGYNYASGRYPLEGHAHAFDDKKKVANAVL